MENFSIIQDGSSKRALALAVLVLFFAIIFSTSAQPLVPEKVPAVVADKQEAQTADRVHLTGWIGSRLSASEANRLVKLDTERLLEGYRTRPGRQIWDGEHVGKWLHASTLAWANTHDPALRTKLDYVAAELVKCQLPDGYLGTYVSKDRWTLWDVWAHKYNLIGLITYMRYTGNLEPLPCCRRMADLLCGTFGTEPGKRDILTAGQHMGMAPTSVLEPMVWLYRLTGEMRYLDFCKYILKAWEGPNGPKIISTLLTQKRVDKVGNGKAYEMLSCVNGALEYYRTTGERQILEACLNGWEDIVNHRLYLTGTASYREFFHGDYDLPNVNNVGETCVTVTWLQFNAQLLRLTGESRFAEQMEKTVLNQLFGAQCDDGSAWGYYVQMQGKKPYSGVLDGHCCLSSGPRGVSLIPTFAVTTDAGGIVVNLYDAGTARLNLKDQTPVTLATETDYPSDETINLTVVPQKPKTFSLKLRIPAWCSSPSIKVNGKSEQTKAGPDGYAIIRREWNSGDKVRVRFPLEPRLVKGDHSNEGRVAALYGPLVLAADEAFLDESHAPLSSIGVRGTDVGALDLRPEPAPARLKSWPRAKVYRINAVCRIKNGATNSERPLQIQLVSFADAGAGGSAYKIWLPSGTMRPDRNLLVDGVEIRSRKPNAGSIIDGDFQTFASTFNNKRAPDDWFGVEMDEPIKVGRVVFAHGHTFHNGGWFDSSAGKPRVEIRRTQNGKWEKLCTLEDYPATTASDPAGLKGGESFSFELSSPAELMAIRVVGNAASGDDPRQSFASCAELQVFGPFEPKTSN